MPGQFAVWHMAEGQATAGTSQCMWHRGGEKVSVLVTQGELWQEASRPGWLQVLLASLVGR